MYTWQGNAIEPNRTHLLFTVARSFGQVQPTVRFDRRLFSEPTNLAGLPPPCLRTLHTRVYCTPVRGTETNPFKPGARRLRVFLHCLSRSGKTRTISTPWNGINVMVQSYRKWRSRVYNRRGSCCWIQYILYIFLVWLRFRLPWLLPHIAPAFTVYS